jgi:hypothetical protein
MAEDPASNKTTLVGNDQCFFEMWIVGQRFDCLWLANVNSKVEPRSDISILRVDMERQFAFREFGGGSRFELKGEFFLLVIWIFITLGWQNQ